MSHFVLRLAHCRGEELRRWFLAQEGELFAARFRDEPGKVLSASCGTLSRLPLHECNSDRIHRDAPRNMECISCACLGCTGWVFGYLRHFATHMKGAELAC